MRVVAHRGASGELPEHTLEAYELAHRQGADGFECDIRLTSDNHLVCFHDRTILRTCVDVQSLGDAVDLRASVGIRSRRGAVSEMPLAQMRELNFGTERRPARVLTFAELLDFYLDARSGDKELFVETKHPNRYGGRVEHELFRELEARDLVGDPRLHVISFHPTSLMRCQRLGEATHRILLRRRLQWVINPMLDRSGVVDSHGISLLEGKMRPDLIDTSWAASGAAGGVAPGAVKEAARGAAGGVALGAAEGVARGAAGGVAKGAAGDTGRDAAAGASGRGTYVWTVNEPQDLAWAAGAGVRWVATDFPARARQL